MGIPLLCLALALMEPFVLRTRHAVMSHYHPARAQERAVWLYNHVLRARHSLAKVLRRQLRRLLEGEERRGEERITCLEWLRARLPWARLVLGGGRQQCCVLCATPEREGDAATALQHCATPGCAGQYCATCYGELGRLCTACKMPVDYGDVSDISDEP